MSSAGKYCQYMDTLMDRTISFMNIFGGNNVEWIKRLCIWGLRPAIVLSKESKVYFLQPTQVLRKRDVGP